MKTYRLQVELKSQTLIGSGEGFGAIVDTDVVFDDVGLVYIPGKRCKGVLRDSALEVLEMFELAIQDAPAPLTPAHIERCFGLPGQAASTPVAFSNLTLEQYDDNYRWLNALLAQKKYAGILSRDRILSTFTELRRQTAIDSETGVADDHSLRTVRVLKKGLVFSGTIRIDEDGPQQDILNLLIFACANLRGIGTKRNRGFGEVRCTLWDGERRLSLKDTHTEEVQHV